MTMTLLLLILLQDPAPLVEKLRSDDLEERAKAAESLRKLGKAAVAPLEKAAKSGDADLASRAKAVLDEIRFATVGRIACFWGAEVIVYDPVDRSCTKAVKAYQDTYWRGIEWLPGQRRCVVSVDIPQEDRFGMGCFPDLWLLDLVGGREDRLTSDRSTSEAAVSPDGAVVAYVAYDAGGGSNLRRVGIDGKEAKALTDDFTKVWEPAWTPDGASILFRAFRRDEKESWGMWRVAAAGGKPERVWDDLSFPQFLPGGKSLLALEYSGLKKPTRLLVVDLAAKTSAAIAKDVSHGSVPRLSPDGKRAVFAREAALFVVGTDGAGEKELAAGAHPTWSPDGASIAFERDGKIVVREIESGRETTLGDGTRPSWSR
jgi:Tol biopolymer transport system component